MFKVYNNLSETIFRDLFFRQENTYNFFRNGEFQISRVKTVWNTSNLIKYFGPIIWDLVLSELKYARLLENSKTEIRKRKPKKYPCRICKTFIQNIGFCIITE